MIFIGALLPVRVGCVVYHVQNSKTPIFQMTLFAWKKSTKNINGMLHFLFFVNLLIHKINVSLTPHDINDYNFFNLLHANQYPWFSFIFFLSLSSSFDISFACRLSGDGFNAWTTYSRCKQNVDQYTAGCFDSDVTDEISFPMRRPGIFAPAPIEKSSLKKKISSGDAKVFSRCELAKELRYKHNLPKDQIHTWVCIAQTLSSLNTAVQAPRNADGSTSYGLFQIRFISKLFLPYDLYSTF